MLFLLIAILSGTVDNSCPDDASSSADVNIVDYHNLDKNAKTIYDYARTEYHATPEAAAALLGNWQKESTLDPKKVNQSSGATGLAQWIDGRLTGLEKFAKSKGKSKYDLGVQLAYAKKEFNDSYYKQRTDRDFKLTNVHDAVKGFLIDYEGMAGYEDQWYLDQRNKYADHWYAKFGNTDSIDAGATNSAGEGIYNTSCDDETSADGDILTVAKGWLGWFHYLQDHSAAGLATLGSDLKNPKKDGKTDCSGFVWLVLNKAGYRVPAKMDWYTGNMADDAKGKHHWFKEVDPSDAQPGDVLLVNVGSGNGDGGHAAIITITWKGKATGIIEEGGVGDSVNESTFGEGFLSLIQKGGDVTVARPIKK